MRNALLGILDRLSDVLAAEDDLAKVRKRLLDERDNILVELSAHNEK